MGPRCRAKEGEGGQGEDDAHKDLKQRHEKEEIQQARAEGSRPDQLITLDHGIT